jgi:proteic killer suppression protein
VEIRFRTRKLAKLCNERREATRAWGEGNAKKLGQRLSEIHASENLAALLALSLAHCHALTGDREGQYAVSLQGPMRLIFLPDHDPSPRCNDGSLDTASVVAIEIIEVRDYHG